MIKNNILILFKKAKRLKAKPKAVVKYRGPCIHPVPDHGTISISITTTRDTSTPAHTPAPGRSINSEQVDTRRMPSAYALRSSAVRLAASAWRVFHSAAIVSPSGRERMQAFVALLSSISSPPSRMA